jgi:hypothetical protein
MSDPGPTTTDPGSIVSEIDRLVIAMRTAAAGFEATQEAAIRASNLLGIVRMMEAKIDAPHSDNPTAEEIEASTIFERVERELPAVEERTERLMHQYGL